MSNLEVLYLGENKITDITALKNLVKLEILGLSDNNITDFSALSSFPKLETVDFKRDDLVDKDITFMVYWKNSKGNEQNREIELNKIKHLGKVTLDDEFINKYAEQ